MAPFEIGAGQKLPKMDISMLDNHPALQVIREEEDSEEENDEIQVRRRRKCYSGS